MTIDNSPERKAMAKITAITQSFYGGFTSLPDALASIGQALTEAQLAPRTCGPHAIDTRNQVWCGSTPVPASHLQSAQERNAS